MQTTAQFSPHDALSHAPATGSLRLPPTEAPYYVAIGEEIALFEAAHADGTAVMLKGPTGCGKTRFVEFMAWRLARPLVTVACHDDLSATDSPDAGLFAAATVWQDGRAQRGRRAHGAICYLDEVVESRQDVVVVIHPLSDHRRLLPIEKHGEIVDAAPGFQLVVSYNPGYQHALKELKPSTRQRFVVVDFDFPPPDVERAIVMHEGHVDEATARRLVELAIRVRRLRDRGLPEVPKSCALLQQADLSRERRGLSVGTGGLTDDPILAAIRIQRGRPDDVSELKGTPPTRLTRTPRLHALGRSAPMRGQRLSVRRRVELFIATPIQRRRSAAEPPPAAALARLVRYLIAPALILFASVMERDCVFHPESTPLERVVSIVTGAGAAAARRATHGASPRTIGCSRPYSCRKAALDIELRLYSAPEHDIAPRRARHRGTPTRADADSGSGQPGPSAAAPLEPQPVRARHPLESPLGGGGPAMALLRGDIASRASRTG
jgi:nitric oxide reductase NorQ protein